MVKVGLRHELAICFVSNSWFRLPDHPLIQRIIVEDGPDVADDWIASRVVKNDIVITQDIPLAARCLKAGARAIGPTGKPFTESTIGVALAMRDLNQHLRETGESRGFNASFVARDRSRFLETLENTIQDVKRES